MLNHFSGKDFSISISTILSTSTAFLTLFMLFNEASNKENHDNQQFQELEGILGFIICVSDSLFSASRSYFRYTRKKCNSITSIAFNCVYKNCVF